MSTHIAFSGSTCLASGSLLDVASCLHAQEPASDAPPPLVFELETGRQIDLDLSGTHDDIVERFSEPGVPVAKENPGRGRPKLGVVGREVTLLPRHWEWLERQRGGASAALRRLVDDARKQTARSDGVRLAQDRTNRFLSAIAGDLPGFEEATRALYAGNERAFREHIGAWPKDIVDCTLRLCDGAF
jgi:hypothetical protein